MKLPDDFLPWLVFGLNDQDEFVCYVHVIPAKPDAAGLMLGGIIQHVIECYGDMGKDKAAAEIWASIIRTSLEPEDRKTYLHFPVQGDES